MNFIAVLDYDHLDNGIFLTAFAQAMAQVNDAHGIIIHGDSDYTERIMQTGIMRDEAMERSIKGLNKRLIALLADEGVSTIGLNSFQRNIVSQTNQGVVLDSKYLDSLPPQPHLLLSNLIRDQRSDSKHSTVPFPLADFAVLLKDELHYDEILIFSNEESDEIFTNQNRPRQINREELSQNFLNQYIPDAFHKVNYPFRLTTTQSLRKLPDLSGTTLIQ